MQEDIANWVKLAEYDLGTAEDMMASSRYLYVLFGCQQAIEKMLKALVVQETKNFPPKTHDLIKLVEIAGLQIDKKKKDFMKKLSYYYIETRYPAELEDIITEIDDSLGKEYLVATKEIYKWLEQRLR